MKLSATRKNNNVGILIVCICFLTFSLFSIGRTAIEYDDSYNATVSKNLALGMGYSTTFPDIKKYNSEISTGPGLLLPIAATIKILGNKYWVPGAVNAVLSTAMLGVLFSLFGAYFIEKNKKSLYTAPIILVFFFLCCFGTGVIGYFNYALGEMGASILVLIGQVFLAKSIDSNEPHLRTKRTFLAGLSFGLALTFKLVVFLQIWPTLVIHGLYGLLSPNRKKTIYTNLFTVALLTVAPMAMFYIMVFLNGNLAEHFAFFKNAGSGISTVTSLSARGGALYAALAGATLDHAQVARFTFGGRMTCLVIVMGIFIGLHSAIRNTKYKTVSNAKSGIVADSQVLPVHLLYLFLVCGSISGMLWFLALSGGWIRHMLPTLIAIIFTFLATPACALGGYKTLSITLVIVFVTSVTGTSYSRFISPSASFTGYPEIVDRDTILSYRAFKLSEDTRQSDQAEVVGFISGLVGKKPNASIYGCAWWVPRDIEYLMPSYKNFKDCLGDEHFLNLKFQPDTYLVIRNAFWNWGNDPYLRKYESVCSKGGTIFKNASYSILKCPT